MIGDVIASSIFISIVIFAASYLSCLFGSFIKNNWRGQVSETITDNQLIFDIVGGIVLPILCLIFDPIVFKGGIGFPFLIKVQIFFYAAITIGMIALMLWFILRRFKQNSGFVVGVLIAGALTSLVLGIAILPLTLIGLIFFIGIVGLAPFVTSFVFFRNSYRAIQQAPQRNKHFWLTMTCGILFALGIPTFLQWQTSAMITSSVKQVVYAENETEAIQSAQKLNRFFDQIPIFTEWQTWQVSVDLTEDMVEGKLSTNRLKHLSRCSRCFDELVSVYQREKNPDKKARIAKIYYEATGEDIDDRVWFLD